jgi:hypothetical protein
MQVVRFMSVQRKKARSRHRSVPLCAVNMISAAGLKNHREVSATSAHARPNRKTGGRSLRAALQQHTSNAAFHVQPVRTSVR